MDVDFHNYVKPVNSLRLEQFNDNYEYILRWITSVFDVISSRCGISQHYFTTLNMMHTMMTYAFTLTNRFTWTIQMFSCVEYVRRIMTVARHWKNTWESCTMPVRCLTYVSCVNSDLPCTAMLLITLRRWARQSICIRSRLYSYCTVLMWKDKFIFFLLCNYCSLAEKQF